MQIDPYPVSHELIEQRRERARQHWSSTNEIVLVGSGSAVSIAGGADQTYPFRAHPHFQWLTGLRSPQSVVAFDPDEGWKEFLHRATVAEKVWEGAGDIDRGSDFTDLEHWLGSRGHRKVVFLGSGQPPASVDQELSKRFDAELLQARRRKDEFEIAAIRTAIAATAEGFGMLPELLRSGITERQAQIELEARMFRAGGERTAYDTIIGFGSNSAVLHFAPTDRPARHGEVVLVDAGVEIGGYVADVTRVFPVDGTFSSEAKELYDRLRFVQRKAIGRCLEGTEWRTVHEQTARDTASELIEHGIIKCGLDQAIEQETIGLFLPHGVGHMVGLGVRDAGGVLAGRPEPARCCGVTLRADLPLEQGFVMTIEPGIYFIPALLDDPDARQKHRDAVDWERAETLKTLGGMRIEDDILVTAGTPVVLTSAIPK